MTKQTINVGTANKGDGDPLRNAFIKINNNFDELYAAMGADVQIPSQATHGGKYLTTNGTTLSWATVLPSLSGNEGSFLRTDGSALNWVALNIPQDTGDLTNNEGFITEASELVNGANTVGLDSLGNLLFTNGEQVKTNFLGGGLELYHSSDNSIGIYGGYARINTFTTGGAKHTWEFDDDGGLTFPQGTFLGYSDPGGFIIDGAVDKDIAIYTYSGADAHGWTFGTDGKLTLPETGTIANSSGAGTSFSATSSSGTLGDTKEFANADVETVTTEFTATGGGISGTATITNVTVGLSATTVQFDQSFTVSGPITFTNGLGVTTLELSPDGTTTWTFGTNGALTFPSGILADLGGAEFGTGFSLTTDGDQAIIGASNLISLETSGGYGQLHLTQDTETNKGRVEILFQNGPGVLWIFDEEDSSLTFPDALSIKDSVIGKASTNTITEGEASQTTAIESQIEITTTGVVIAKRTSVTVNDGVITTVNDSGSTLELDNTHASITYYIEPDGPDNNSLIQFTTDSSAGGGATIETVTEDVGGTAHGRVRAAGNSVQVSAKTFLGTNKTWSFTGAGDLQLPESGNILSNGANYIDLANFETSYNDAEGAYQDALTAWMTLETFRPVWFALPGRLAYDEMIAWTPTTGQPALPLNLPPVAKNAQDSYAAWQETIALSKLTVASDIAEFDFNSTGKLRLPQGGTVGGGDQADIDAAYDDWQADEAAWQYLITTGGADFNVRPWNFAGPSRAEKQAIVLSMWQAQQSGAAIDWVPISSAFYDEARAWLAVTANQDGYDEWKKLTTSVNITSDDKTWAFTNDGRTTFPNGVVPEHSYGAAGDKEGMVVLL
jgi:hypothetical protein